MDLQSIVGFVGALSALVLVHELGHFIVAKSVGIRVESFSLFFGQPLIAVRRAPGGGWRYRSLKWSWGLPEEAFSGGETEYAVRWLPFGGYVRMSGQSDFGEAERTGEPWDFSEQPIWARSAVVAAGPAMNFVLAVLVLAVLNNQYGVIGQIGIAPGPAMSVVSVEPGSVAEQFGVMPGAQWVGINGSPVSDWASIDEAIGDGSPVTMALETPSGDTLNIEMEPELANMESIGIEWQVAPSVAGVIPLEPADVAGMAIGDLVISVAGENVASWSEMSKAIRRRPGLETAIVVRRDGATKSLLLTPVVQVERNGLGDGVRLSPLYALGVGAGQTWDITVKLVKYIKGLVTRAISPEYLAGPIGIFTLTGNAVHKGLAPYVYLIAVLSANLAFINLLPLAVLDGGHLGFFAFEAVTRRRPSARQQGIIQQVGMVILLAMMLAVTIVDLKRMLG